MQQAVRRMAATMLRAAIRGYQLTLASLFPGACRFEPSCSHYAYAAIGLHGPLKGGLLAVRRLCRCHPWGGCGLDPVPPPNGLPVCTAADRG